VRADQRNNLILKAEHGIRNAALKSKSAT